MTYSMEIYQMEHCSRMRIPFNVMAEVNELKNYVKENNINKADLITDIFKDQSLKRFKLVSSAFCDSDMQCALIAYIYNDDYSRIVSTDNFTY